MKRGIAMAVAGAAVVGLVVYAETTWKVHDESRPRPPVVTPGATSMQPPSDAIVLFNGSGLGAWTSDRPWKIEEGTMTPAGGGDIRTTGVFGSIQLHVEWATPKEVKGAGQGRGNSGVFLMDKYEVQVLDSYNSPTYADGQAAAIYGQQPPAVNACRGPGEWQTYDIVFHRPVFDSAMKKVIKPATITVIHNGVLVHDHYEIKGTTFHGREAAYEPHAAKMPFKLQDHGNPVHYRNVWLRELPE